ncbi:MAG: tetratricopeptide repeat protein [Bryobacteraceae bacterium]
MNRRIIRFAAVALICTGSVLAQRPATSNGTGNLGPNDAHAQVERALSLLKAGQDGKAAVYLDRALRILGETAQAAYPHYLRAKVYTDQSSIPKAITELKKSVALEPNYAAAWSDLGQARKALSDDIGALAAYKRAVELDPNDAVAQYRLGAEYLQQGKAHLAVQHLEEALSLNPGGQSALYSLQLALRQDGRSAEANKVRKRLADLLHRRDVLYQNALKAVAINNEGAVLQKRGDLRGALEKYQAALNLSPGEVRIRVNFAIALLRLGQWDRGLSELHKAMRQDPGNDLLKKAWDDAVSQAPAGTSVNGIPLQPIAGRQSRR